MAEEALLGLFDEVGAAAAGIEGLRRAGVPDDDVTVISGVHYDPKMLGRPPVRGGLMRLVVGGAFLGIVAALFLTVGIFLLYPLYQGGQPLIPVPPSLIIIFEVAMLGTMWTAFFGFLGVNRFPVFGRPVYDVRVTAGEIGVIARVDAASVAQAESALRDGGATDVQRLQDGGRVSRRDWWLFLGSLAAPLVLLVGLAFAFWYSGLNIGFPTQMYDQQSVGFVEGPRMAAPAEAVPIQGPVLIAGEPATAPLPATQDSVQRGHVLFGVICVTCHGDTGDGKGPLAPYFTPPPFDLTSTAVQSLPDPQIFLAINQGFGIMPSLAENLDAQDTWDVINYVRTLKK